MTDSELIALFDSINDTANTIIDLLIKVRQASADGRKQRLSYLIKKLEIIVGASNRALDKLNGT
jgi:hypothetical protein